MTTLQVFAIISWVSLPTVAFGGYSLLRLLSHGDKLTPFQINNFRAGHAHAGVLLVMSLVFYEYLAKVRFAPRTQLIVCVLLAVGIITQSGGFFLHMGFGKPGQPSWGTRVTQLGALLLATSLLILVFGLVMRS